uniref:(northern house mosquito) hypothetical protein n=1 Tax=Culex pipiens TaxID=7175 RepID=A0A8D8B285_CULPI
MPEPSCWSRPDPEPSGPEDSTVEVRRLRIDCMLDESRNGTLLDVFGIEPPVGGERLMLELRRSWGPMLEWRLIGRPPPGVPPGDEAQDGAIRILGVMSVLSDSRRLGKALTTRRKLLSGDEGDPPNHQLPLRVPVEFFRAMSSALDVLRWSMRKFGMLNCCTFMLSDEN